MSDTTVSSTTTPPDVPPADTTQSAARARYFRIFGIVMLVLGLAVLAWVLLFAGHSESTDDAYVGGDTAAVTPLVSGAVAEVRVSDTQSVKKGDVLVVIDDADARVALAQADAEVQRAMRKVQGYFATDGGLRAQEDARQALSQRAKAQVDQARDAYEKAQGDLSRRAALVSEGAVSGEEVANARNAVSQAKASLEAAEASYAEAKANESVARGSLVTNHALIAGDSPDNNPEVAAARAKRDAAALDLSRTVLRAPFDGVIARRQVQVGQRVQSGATLMTVVPTDELYVDANFKEDQLRKIKPGQPVTLISDRYGSGVVYHGKVVGFAGGTGSAFAIIPAQNATGNWIKVVQRVPLRIALSPDELRQHPLLVGLSMTATVEFN
jgi:membrane fusion protein (multidrug efflux system)